MTATQTVHAFAIIISVPTYLAGHQQLVDVKIVGRDNPDTDTVRLAKRRFAQGTGR